MYIFFNPCLFALLQDIRIRHMKKENIIKYNASEMKNEKKYSHFNLIKSSKF